MLCPKMVTTIRALLLLSLAALVQALVPAGTPPAHSGSRTVKHFFEPHPLRFIHIFGRTPNMPTAR